MFGCNPHLGRCAPCGTSESDSNTQQMDYALHVQMDVDNSETDSDYNPDPDDFVNFVVTMYQTPQVPVPASTAPICYGWERGCTCHGWVLD
jgi:hypothetical protein